MTAQSPGTDIPGHDDAQGRPLMNLLAGHVPISLIMDLAMPTGPHSSELLQAEADPHLEGPESR